MDKQSKDQEQTIEPSSENTNIDPNETQKISPPVDLSQPEVISPPDMPPEKKSKKAIFIILAVLMLGIGAMGIWYFLNKESSDKSVSTDSVQETAEIKPFNNVLYYAYYENGKTYVKSVDLNEQSPEKKTLIEFEEGGVFSENEPDGIHSRMTAPVSISKDGKTVLYSAKNGVYEHNLENDSRTSLLKFEWKKDFVGDEILDKVIVTDTGENIRDVKNENIYFRALRFPTYSYVKNAFGFAEAHYEGGSVDVFDREMNSLVDIGDTFTYLGVAEPGALAFEIKDEAKELIDYGLYPRDLFDVTGGSPAVAIFNQSRENVAAMVNLYDSDKDYTDYDSMTLVVVDPITATHKTISTAGKYTYELAYQSNDMLYIVDADGKSFTLRQFGVDLEEITAKDLSKLSGILGEVVDVNLQVINDKIYIEITTKKDEKFRTYIYNYDEDKVITDFLIAEDSDVKILKHE